MTILEPTVTTFRDTYEAMVPRWLKGWNEDPETGVKTVKRMYRVGYSVALHLDWLADYATASVKYGFPGGYLSDFDRYIGAERRIPRGYAESASAYQARCRLWRDAHARKGVAWCLLEMLHAYFTGHEVHAEVLFNVNASLALVYTLESDGTMTTSARAWNWDGLGASLPSRFWVILYVPATVASACPTWGDGGWESTEVTSETIGSTAPYWMVQNVKAIVRDWGGPGGSAAAICSYIIVVFDSEDWAAQQPDGTWDHMANRNPNACYWKGYEG